MLIGLIPDMDSKSMMVIVLHASNNFSLVTRELHLDILTLMNIKYVTLLINTLLALFMMLTFTPMHATVPIDAGLTTLYF